MKETLNPNTRYFETLHIIRFELSWANRLFQVRSESRSDGFCCYSSVTTHLSSFLYISYLYNLLVSLYRGGQCGQKNTERDWELKEYLECSCNPQPPPPLKNIGKWGGEGEGSLTPGDYFKYSYCVNYIQPLLHRRERSSCI